VANVAGGSTYLVPDGDVGVLRDMTLWLPAGTPVTFASALTVACDTALGYVWDIAGINARPGVYRWTGREVFNTALLVQAWTHPFSFRASGYILTAT
jgi:hypothetical protein